MRKIESFKDQDELIADVGRLKSQGVFEKDIAIVSSQPLRGEVENYPDVDYRRADGNAWDKVVSWFTRESTETHVMNDLKLTSKEEEQYKSALDRGEILLYVNESSGKRTIDPEQGEGNDEYAEIEGQEVQNTRDNRALENDGVTGQHEQNIIDTDRDDPPNDRKNPYKVDKRAFGQETEEYGYNNQPSGYQAPNKEADNAEDPDLIDDEKNSRPAVINSPISI